MKKLKKQIIEQYTPILLTLMTFFVLAVILYGILIILANLPLGYPVILDFRRREPLIGIIIYLKTAFDFAIYISNLMSANPSWKKRISISISTAVGNALGLFLMLIVWTIAREVRILVVIFLFFSSIILLRLAEESFEEFLSQRKSFIKLNIKKPVSLFYDQLSFINKIFNPLLKYFVKHLDLTKTKKLSFLNLTIFSITIPFVLGFNNFSAYIPLHSYINIFGFTLGILLGHMLLTMAIFAFPKKTLFIVKHPLLLISGGLIFIVVSIFGFLETILAIASLI